MIVVVLMVPKCLVFFLFFVCRLLSTFVVVLIIVYICGCLLLGVDSLRCSGFDCIPIGWFFVGCKCVVRKC